MLCKHIFVFVCCGQEPDHMMQDSIDVFAKWKDMDPKSNKLNKITNLVDDQESRTCPLAVQKSKTCPMAFKTCPVAAQESRTCPVPVQEYKSFLKKSSCSFFWRYLGHPGKTQVFLVTGRFPLDLGGCLARGFALFSIFTRFGSRHYFLR